VKNDIVALFGAEILTGLGIGVFKKFSITKEWIEIDDKMKPK